MAYIGQAPFQEFTSVPTKDNFTGDGSTTAFDLSAAVPVGSENALEVFVNNVRQEPGSGKAFTLGQDGNGDYKRITFASAPTDGHAMYVINDRTSFTSIAPLPQDLNGSELILDADADTSITASTDDQIDFKIAGADDFTFTANAFNVLTGSHATFADSANAKFGTGSDMLIYHDGTNSYITNAVGGLRIATETSGIAVTIGHSTSEVTIADNATVAGNLTVTGTLTQTGTQTFDGGIDVDDFNINGTTIALSSGDMTVDVAGDITLDADGGDIFFKDGGTTFGSAVNTSGNLIIKSGTTTALTFSGANVTAAGTITGNLTGNASGTTATVTGAAQTNITSLGTLTALTVDDVAIDGKVMTMTGSSGDTFVTTVAANGATSLVTTDAAAAAAHLQITADGTVDIDSAGVLTLDSGAAINIEPASGSAILLDGTISIDAGVVTGATSITSTAFVGGLTGNVTGNASGTALTVTQAAQSAITSVGTLTALTVDDVAVDGKVITMTGSSSDTAVFTAGTNGTLSIVTTDAAAAAANIQITADGTAELAGTTVTLDSSGGITLDADGGTITFADAGSSLGTITSSGYSGTAAVATTVTVTDNEDTNENNVLTFVAGADADGGNVGLESDGNLNYNPSTGTLNVPNISVTGTQTIVNSVTMNASNAVIFEGATADAHETTLSTIDATGDRTINLPNVSGTLPVLAAASATQITSTPAELNLIDGGTARGTTAVASGDGILINDGGTMRMTNVDTVSTYFSSHNVGGGNIITTGALGSGSIATGFGAIDNGTSNVTTGGLLSLDTDADADDNTADSSSGRLTIGAGGDLNLYHGGTNSYIVNSTGSLYIHSETDDSDIIFTGEDGSSGITALTLDMSAAGKATFNDGIVATTGVFSGVVDADAGITVDNITIDGTEIDLSSGDLTVDVAGDIILDADGGEVLFHDATTAMGHISMAASNITLKSLVSDKDMIFQGNDGGSGITALTLDMSAAGAATFNNDVTAFSDARLKDNVETIPNALETVCAMRGVTFTRNDNNDQPGTGVIAQEMQEVFPVVVKENNDENNTLSVSYGNLVGVLIESIKELKTEIDTLKGV